MRFLFVVPGIVDSATARYRCAHLAEALTLAGHQADVVSATETASIRVEHDVVVLHRIASFRLGVRLFAAARTVGAAVVYSADDLIFEPEFAYQVGLAHPKDPARYHYHRAEVDEARKCFQICDAALVSTDFLAARARFAFTDAKAAEVKPVYVVRNFLGADILHHSEDAWKRRQLGISVAGVGEQSDTDDRIVLGYLSGSPTHDADLADIAPALASVLARSPASRLLLVGPASIPMLLQTALHAGQVRSHPFVPWRDLPGLLAGIDINLAPLDTSRIFNHAKSEVKFLEAAAVGIPTLAGAGIGFAEGVRDGENCVLVRRHSDWEETLWRLMSDADERGRIGGAARRSLTARGTVSSSVDSINETFIALADYRRPGLSKSLVVRQPVAERCERAFRRVEETFLRRCFRTVRHLKLLQGE